MKYLYIIFSIALFSSCVPEIPKELDGNWIIVEMKYDGKNVYPETSLEKLHLEFDPVGYEGAEKIKFNTADSTVLLPGFKSPKRLGNFTISNNQIKFFSKDSAKNEIVGKVFFQTYKVNRMNSKRELILSSNLTTMRIIDENVLFEHRIRELLN